MKSIIIIAIIIVAFVVYRKYFSEINESDEEFNDAVLKNIEKNIKNTEDNKKKTRKNIGSFPAIVIGKVSFTHHIGSDPGIDMIWLEEYGELEFFISSDLFDEIDIDEDNSYSLMIIEKDDEKLWIQSGQMI